MGGKLLEHVLSVVVVTALLLLALAGFNAARRSAADAELARFARLGDLAFVDTNDPFERALLKDAVNVFYAGQRANNDALVAELIEARQKEFSDRLQKGHLAQSLNADKLRELAAMYLKFLIVYVVVMALTYYGVQTIGVWRFCRRHRADARHGGFASRIKAIASRLLLGAASFVLFCPAYVIAYSIRTELNTDTAFFMALLGIISNGLLMVYANKFYAFLVTESRRGYVETAVVKNLNASYNRRGPGGIPLRAILRPIKRFKGHVFGHIFANARHQYLSTIKEQASFLITGLIIIEMALNIHGHLSYEMLRQMLYRNYDIVTVIILGVFYTVKATEVFTDALVHRAGMRYENRG
jgi:hypothetical protein